MEELTEKRQEKFMELSNTEPKGVVHVTINFTEEATQTDTFGHSIGAAVENFEGRTKEFDVLEVPTLIWGVFRVEGKWEEVDTYWTRIYSEWLPSSSYQLAQGPEILASKENHSEIWLPVKETSN